MRRTDREVKETEKINQIIQSCDCCRLGFHDGIGTYILPLNFGFTEQDGKRLFYFHGAKEGKKIELIKEQPRVGFELDTKHELEKAESACEHSFLYQSVIGQGNISIITDDSEKKIALNAIMMHYTDKKSWDFPKKILDKTAVMKMEVIELSCKEHLTK